MQTVITTKGLCKAYGRQFAVDHLDLAVPEGCVYGFIGPNGAGKSTTMKMLLGLIHPSAGQVTLLGQPMNAQNRLALLQKTGSLIESPAGYGHLTGQENLEIVADLKGVPCKDIARVLDIVHLTGDKYRKVREYSLGMRQRLGIAQALLGSPQLLILDEPTNGLDPAGIQEMRALIAGMPDACGATVLISSHLLSELEQIVGQVGILNKGRLLFQGPLRELQRHSLGDIELRVLRPQKAAETLRQSGIRAEAGADGLFTLPPLRAELLAELVHTLADRGAGVVGHQPPHQDAGGNFPEPDRPGRGGRRGGGAPCLKPCMPSSRKPAAGAMFRSRWAWALVVILWVGATYEIESETDRARCFTMLFYAVPLLNTIVMPLGMAALASRLWDCEDQRRKLQTAADAAEPGKPVRRESRHGPAGKPAGLPC